jgi:hypothetical protein
MLFIRFLNLLNIAFVVNKGTIKNNIHVHMKRHWTTHTLKKENMNNEVQTIDRIIHLITYQIVMQM